MKVFVSWSGGKDSCLSCYEAISQGHEVACLLNMVTEDEKWSMSHGVSSELLKTQAQAMGIPLVQQRTLWNEYEQQFKKAITRLMKEGVEGGVFGDIGYLQDHQDWVHRVCADLGIKPIMPLWGRETRQAIEDFIRAGFEAVVATCKDDVMGEEWLGRTVDDSFVQDLVSQGGIDPSGEFGEYHTFVIDGPIFQRRLKITRCQKTPRENRWFLDILECE